MHFATRLMETGPASKAAPPVAPAIAQATSVPPSVHRVLRSPGEPLDSQTRDFFESGFNRDFSRVRWDTGFAQARRLAALLQRSLTNVCWMETEAAQ